jgi:hypothetical protein
MRAKRVKSKRRRPFASVLRACAQDERYFKPDRYPASRERNTRGGMVSRAGMYTSVMVDLLSLAMTRRNFPPAKIDPIGSNP